MAMKRSLYKLLCLVIFLASLCLSSCGNGDDLTFDVPEKVEVNYQRVYTIPQIVATDKDGADYIADIKVKNSSGQWVQVYNNSLPVEDANGYQVIYTIDYLGKKLSKTMEIKVKDTTPPNIVIGKRKTFIVNLFNGDVDFEIPVEDITVTDNKTSDPTITYEVYFGEEKVGVTEDLTFTVSETGVYDIVVKAQDEDGNSSERTIKVGAVNRSPEVFMDFEAPEGLELHDIYTYELSSNEACSFALVKCKETALPQSDYLNGEDNTLLRVKPNSKTAIWPTFFFDLRETIPSGSVVKFKYYLAALAQPQDGAFAIEVPLGTPDDSWQCLMSTKLEINQWNEVTAVVRTDRDNLSVYLSLVGFDGRKNVFLDSTLLDLYIDDVIIEKAPYIYLDRGNTTFTANVSEGTFKIPANLIKAAGKQPVTLSYSAYFGNDELTITNGAFPLSEAGIYRLKVTARDGDGRESERIFCVNAVSASPSSIGFENADDIYFIGSADPFGKDSYNALNIERVAYDDSGITAPGSGNQYAAKLNFINNHSLASVPGEGLFINVGRRLEAGTVVSFRLYFETPENPAGMFTIVSDSNDLQAAPPGYRYNTWIQVGITLKADSDYVQLDFKAQLPYDPLQSYIANASKVNIYIDDIYIVKFN